ncbi:RNA polymerase sigma-70 factor [Variovorax arabinosiphilus]|uniref:RNA polymerase sigma-70 factor n=1 Tax=Variovorax arabinosiphilus TaxID=3053498 RepID=UPI0025760034|nr:MULTISPECIES: RNA polymerase sigma-70 factor [unclassified Variovorax]MDM0121830.1 RNA polymerase sigma-70 factor [Variovorax sp. J2L1-78]MDM0131640.1 RNA polymerase sigma-70 factor [Variovorax sp. J2L1-63]MDM0234593.1 RNA polymerase sigma-70 factor [Variovorax sp. J2R1-6]
MDAATLAFDRHRPRLKGIAYRMLGSVAEAEDVVQDAWLRWNEAAHDALESAEAWLVTVTTRIAIDRLRAAQAQRTHYVGTWLPEPFVNDDPEGPATPEQLLGRAEDLSMAFLTVLERLAPEARAAFLLREVFEVDYDEIAQTLGKSQAACRQLVHRAKTQVREDDRPKQAVPRDIHLRLLRGFADAAQRGDLHALKALLTEDVAIIGDGGGKVPSFGQPVVGGQRVAQIYFAVARRFPGAVRIEVVDVNGVPGLLRWVDGVLESVQGIEWDGERIVRIHAQRNPDKLARIAAEFSR